MNEITYLDNAFVEFEGRDDINGYAAEAAFAAFAFSVDKNMRWLGGNTAAVDIIFEGKTVDVKSSFIEKMYGKDGLKRDCVAFMSSRRRRNGEPEARTDLVSHYGLVIPSSEGAFIEGTSPDNGLEINIRFNSPKAILLVPSMDINKYFQPACLKNGVDGKGSNIGLDIKTAKKYLIWGSLDM